MNHLLNITRKELKELLTPGAIASIVIVVVMFSVLGNIMSGESEQEAAPKEIGILFDNDYDEVLISFSGTDVTVNNLLLNSYMSTYGIKDAATAEKYIHRLPATCDTPDKIAGEMGDKGYSFVVVIPKDIKTNIGAQKSTGVSSYYAYSNGGIFSSVSSISSATLVSYMNTYLSYYISAYEASSEEYAQFALNPISNTSNYTNINGKVYENIMPYQIFSAMMSQNLVVPIIVMIVIMMVGSVVISSMGSEKENKTLETLLTMPIKRTTIVSGKLLAAAIMGLIYGICYLVGMMVYSNGITSSLGGSSVNLADYGLSMTTADWAIMLLMLFLSIFSALGICMILGAFTKNYKMAQTMTLPISGLALVPMLVFMFSSWESLPFIGQALMFIIPFSHPMMAMNNLIFGNMMLVYSGLIYLVVFDIIMVLVTVKVYSSDILITGLQHSKSSGRISKLFKSKGDENGDN